MIVIAEKSDELKREFDIDEEDDEDAELFFDPYLTVSLDPKSSGITIVDERNTIGCNEVPFTTVNFSDVRIGKDQILSESFDDRKISQKLIASSRLKIATLNMIQAKKMFNHLVNFSLSAECNSEKIR